MHADVDTTKTSSPVKYANDIVVEATVVVKAVEHHHPGSLRIYHESNPMITTIVRVVSFLIMSRAKYRDKGNARDLLKVVGGDDALPILPLQETSAYIGCNFRPCRINKVLSNVLNLFRCLIFEFWLVICVDRIYGALTYCSWAEVSALPVIPIQLSPLINRVHATKRNG